MRIVKKQSKGNNIHKFIGEDAIEKPYTNLTKEMILNAIKEMASVKRPRADFIMYTYCGILNISKHNDSELFKKLQSEGEIERLKDPYYYHETYIYQRKLSNLEKINIDLMAENGLRAMRSIDEDGELKIYIGPIPKMK